MLGVLAVLASKEGREGIKEYLKALFRKPDQKRNK